MADITDIYSTTLNARGGETGVGLRWVLGVSLAVIIAAFMVVVGVNIAG